MTCVVGMVYQDHVYLGADSACISGNHKDTIKQAKVFEKNSFVVGCAGLIKGINILRLEDWPENIYDDPEEYLYNLMKWYRKQCEKHKIAEVDNEVITNPIEAIFGYHNRIFTVEGAFGVTESSREYVAIGSGSSYAFGSLFTNKSLLPRDNLHTALVASAHFCNEVFPPFIFINNEDS